jgi:restriction system protein
MTTDQYSDAFIKGLLQGFVAVWPLWVLLGALFGGALLVGLWKQWRITKSGMRQIDRMTGLEFERYLEWLFRRLGYGVQRTRYQGDYGADLVASKDGVKTAIQAKRSKRRIGIKAVQQAFASTGVYECEQSIVVTNAFFTRAATRLAKADKVELWDRNRLMKAMASVGGKGTVAEALAPPEPPSVRTRATLPDGRSENPSPAVCAVCGQRVSDRVRDYCVANASRFRGRILCYGHQRPAPEERNPEN